MGEAVSGPWDTPPTADEVWSTPPTADEMGPARGLTSRAQAALKGVQDIPTMGWGDEVGGALQAGLLKLTGDPSPFSENYRRARDDNRAESARASEDRPGYYYGAGSVAALPTALAMPGLTAAKGAGLWTRAAVSGANLAGQGAVGGLGASEATDAAGLATDTATGAGASVALGSALSGVSKVGGSLARGVVKPSAAALQLEAQGVRGLSIGQMAPGSSLAMAEEAGLHTIGSGPAIQAQRAAGAASWQNAVLSRGLAPGDKLAAQGDVSERLAAAYKGFEPAYAGIRAAPIRGAGAGEQSVADQMRKGFASVTDDPAVYATDADRGAASKFLQNQASLARFEPGVAPTAEPLMSVRSNIRGAVRDQLGGANPNYAAAGLLRNAEESVTDTLKRSLPPDEIARLAAVDAKYAEHKVVSDAVRRSGDQSAGFTPAQLSAAVRANAEGGAYARGGGGELRDLAAAGRETLETKSPATGVRALIAAVPGGQYVTSPAMMLANTGPGRSLLLGRTGAQQSAQSILDSLGRAAPAGRKAMSLASRQSLIAELLRNRDEAFSGESP